MTTTFQRQANRLLVDAGYEFVQANGSGHEVWRKSGVPDIHVPGSPSGGRDSMLLRITRAIRKGTALTPPSGQETDMPAAKKQVEVPVSAQMVELASKQMLRDADLRAKARTQGERYTREHGTGYVEDQAAWLKRCIDKFGRLSGGDLAEAGAALEIPPADLSIAKKTAGVITYRTKDMPARATWTVYTKDLPADAILFTGRRKPEASKQPKKSETPPLPPPDPEHVGRRLERGDLTDEEHAAAERQMREAHLRAEQERQDILATRTVPGPQTVVGEQGENGVKSQLDIAMQLLREAALADTHAITPGDIILLRGHHDTLLRTADDLRGMAASITSILVRVQAGLNAEGQPVGG